VAPVAEGWRDRLLRLLKVPAEPEPPPGDVRLLRTFRAAPSYFGYSVAKWVLKQASAAVGLLFSYMFVTNVLSDLPIPYFGMLELLFVTAFVAQLPFSYMVVRLDFEMRWYMLTDRSMRIRHGILSVHEQTMTFANVQNITIRQNPLQRLFGIATIAVRAAGGGGSESGSGGKSSGTHEAVFEGVDDAVAIRDVIRDRLRQYRDAGLGDLDESSEQLAAAPAHAGNLAAPAAAAGRLLDEVRSMRALLSRG
jgi:uncharacterized membrane protein YdbT with pleckstrin-like domain